MNGLAPLFAAAPPAGVEWSERHIHITDPTLPFERFEEILLASERIGDSMRFWIGDLLIFGENRYGELFAQATSRIALRPETLMDYRRVAERVRPGRRRAALSWSYHRVVAPLENDDQERWLEAAEKNDWTVTRLKDEIAAAGLKPVRQIPDTNRKPPRQEVLPPEQTGDAVIGLLAVRDTLATVATALDTPEAREAVGLPAALRGLDDAGKAIKDAVGVLANKPALLDAWRKLRAAAVRQSHIAEPAYIVPGHVFDEFAAFVAEHYDEEGES